MVIFKIDVYTNNNNNNNNRLIDNTLISQVIWKRCTPYMPPRCWTVTYSNVQNYHSKHAMYHYLQQYNILYGQQSYTDSWQKLICGQRRPNCVCLVGMPLCISWNAGKGWITKRHSAVSLIRLLRFPFDSSFLVPNLSRMLSTANFWETSFASGCSAFDSASLIISPS